MKVTPINIAEAVIEPFWNSDLYSLDSFNITADDALGFRIYPGWCSLPYEWAGRAPDGHIFTMEKDYVSRSQDGLSIAGYDTLILSAMAPEHAVVSLSAVTESGTFTFESEPFGLYKRELPLKLEGSYLKSIRITLSYHGDGSMGWFNWLGLASSALLPVYLNKFEHFDADWEGLLLPPDTDVSFKPRYGIFFDSDDLLAMRKRYSDALNKGARSPFVPVGYANFYTPERFIKEFVNFWDDTRYCRERDTGKELIRYGVKAAMLGVLEQDKEMLRLAARYAMSILQCDNWDDGMICRFPVGAWEHRCFVQSLCLYDLVFIYDLAWEYFTKPGKELLFRRIVEEGLAAIDYTTFKHEYIFSMNQLIWFSHGRMAAYALISKEFPRTKDYMRIAYNEIVENLEKSVLPDGGYVEGPTYFNCVGNNGGQALHAYARAEGMDISTLIPQNVKNSASFADVLASTDETFDMIPICDARPTISHEHLSFMAYILPDSRWCDIFVKAVRNAGGMPETYFGLYAQDKIPAPTGSFKPFVMLPDMKVAASEREYDGKRVKLFFMGNRAGAGHTHEDKGSFVLEFAGHTFACDPGTCDYSSPYSILYKYCDRHNMLVPNARVGRAAPDSPCDQDIMPEGHGDEQQCSLFLPAGLAFPHHYKYWNRTIESPAPNQFTISDDYELLPDCGCDGVSFYWNTTLPVKREGNTFIITAPTGEAIVTVPEGLTAELETLDLFGGGKQMRIAVLNTANAAKMSIRVELRTL